MDKTNLLREMQMPFLHRAVELPAGPFDGVINGVREVPVKEAKAKLTELLRAAEAGERIVLTRHGKPVADLVPHANVPMEKPLSPLEGVKAWHKANPSPNIGWISDDFDDQLPEDFLLHPFPDDFDQKLAEHDQRITDARKKWEAERK